MFKTVSTIRYALFFVTILMCLIVIGFLSGFLKLNMNQKVEFLAQEAQVPGTYYCYSNNIVELNKYERGLRELESNTKVIQETFIEPELKKCIETCVLSNIENNTSEQCGPKCGAESGTFEIANIVGTTRNKYQHLLDTYCE